MDQTWPLYVSYNLILNIILLTSVHNFPVKIWSISCIQKQRYCRNSQNIVLIWPKHGPFMVPIFWHKISVNDRALKLSSVLQEIIIHPWPQIWACVSLSGAERCEESPSTLWTKEFPSIRIQDTASARTLESPSEFPSTKNLPPSRYLLIPLMVFWGHLGESHPCQFCPVRN